MQGFNRIKHSEYQHLFCHLMYRFEVCAYTQHKGRSYTQHIVGCKDTAVVIQTARWEGRLLSK